MYYMYMDNKKKLGLRIKEFRKQRGFTQEQLAELVDMEQNSISVIESGRNFPTLVTLEKIADVLNVDISDFFNYDSFDDIDFIKMYTENKLKNMNENQLRQIYKYIKNVM